MNELTPNPTNYKKCFPISIETDYKQNNTTKQERHFDTSAFIISHYYKDNAMSIRIEMAVREIKTVLKIIKVVYKSMCLRRCKRMGLH